MGAPRDPGAGPPVSPAGGEATSSSTPPADGASSLPPAAAPPPARAPLLDARAALALLALYLGAQLLVGFAIGTFYGLARFLAGEGGDAEALERSLADVQGPIGVIGALAAGAAVLAVVVRRARRPDGEAVRRQVGLALGSGRVLALGLLAGALLALVYFPVVSGLLFAPEPDRTPGPVTRMLFTPGWERWLWTYAALLVAPPVEELLFRGVLQAGFARSWGWGPAAAVTTALFVSLHYAEFRTYLPAAGALVAISALTLWLRRRTGALGPAVAAHGGYNLAVLLLANLGMHLQGRA